MIRNMMKNMSDAINNSRRWWKQMCCRHKYEPMTDGNVCCRTCGIVFYAEEQADYK